VKGGQVDNYKGLVAWQKADSLAIEVYKATALFPREEQYGVTSQLRRAILSVPLNLVEGYARGGKAEFARFLDISIGSVSEAKYLIEFSEKIGYIGADAKRLYGLAEEVSKILWSLKKSVKSRQK